MENAEKKILHNASVIGYSPYKEAVVIVDNYHFPGFRATANRKRGYINAARHARPLRVQS